MNDIQLVKSGENTYDWNFGPNDVVSVIGDEQTRNAVRHAVLLHHYELDYFPYINLGSSLDKYVKENNIENVVSEITEEIRLTCKGIDGVEDAMVEIEMEERNIMITEITVMLENGREVNIYAT